MPQSASPKASSTSTGSSETNSPDSQGIDTSFDQAIRNIQISSSQLSPSKSLYLDDSGLERNLLSVREELEKLVDTQARTQKKPRKDPKITMNSNTLPDFANAGRYNGDIPASRWITRLIYDFKKAGQPVPDPELFLEAVEMLLEGEPARRLDSTPRIRRLIDNREAAAAAHVNTVKEWLMEEFPTSVEDVTEIDVQSEIESLEQGPAEALASYYQRTLGILRKTHGRDRPRDTDRSTTLSGLEVTMLNCVVNAFVKGLFQDNLRKAALQKDAATCGALWKSYEMVQAAQRSLQLEKQIEEALSSKKRLADLEKFVLDHHGRTATVVLAEVKQNPHALMRTMPNAQASYQNSYNAYPASRPQQSSVMPIQNPPQSNSSQPRLDQKQAPFRGYGQGGNSGNYQGNSGGYQRPASQSQNRGGQAPLPPASQSKNPVINGSEVHDRRKTLCVQCGQYGHLKPQCRATPLSYWEQSYLRQMVFQGSANSYYTSFQRGEGGWTDGSGTPLSDTPLPSFQEQEPTISFQEYSGGSGSTSPMFTPSADGSFQSDNHSLSLGMARDPEQLQHGSQVDPVETVLSFDSFMARTRKRQRVQTDSTEDDMTSRPSPTSRKAPKTVKRSVRELREILGRKGLGPINYTEIAKKFTADIDLITLLQMSPDARRGLREVGMPVTVRKAKSTGKPATPGPDPAPQTSTQQERPQTRTASPGPSSRASPAPPHPTVQFEHEDPTVQSNSNSILKSVLKKAPEEKIVTLGTPIGPSVHPDDKAFKVPVTFRVKYNGKSSKVTMPLGITHADQGSDMNLITRQLCKTMGFPEISLTSKGWSGLTMNTADGNSSPLELYTTFQMGVLGIWRSVYAFIRPETKGVNSLELGLILGLPWLDDVDAKIRIRASTIDIGDIGIGEKIAQIKGPVFVPSGQHRLILHPKVPGQPRVQERLPLTLPKFDPQIVEESESSDADDESGYTDVDSSSGSEN
jgi:hypothetical protein